MPKVGFRFGNRRWVQGSLSLAAALVCVLSPAAFAEESNAFVAPAARTTRSSAIRILSPKDNAFFKSATLRTRVRVRPGHFKAFLNGRDVTRRFTGGAVRIATFKRGVDFKAGAGNLFVSVGRGKHLASAQSTFVAERRSDGILAARVTSHVAKRVMPTVHVRSKRRLRHSKIWLNGHRVDKHFDSDDDLRGTAGQLGADAGVRAGRNTVTIEALQTDGRYARRSTSFVVSPRNPIASAGPDRRIGVGGRVTLDATASKRPRSRSGTAHGAATTPLRYRWKLVSVPPGSKAKIAGTTSATPALVPDVPGRYIAQVAVRTTASRRSVDDVEVDAPQSVAPMGMPIETITSSGGIQIGDPNQLGAANYPKIGGWVQMLVLDPDTGTPLPGPWDANSGVSENQRGVLGFNPGQSAPLLAAVKATQPQELVILSGEGNHVSLDRDNAMNLTAALDYLGGTAATNGPAPIGSASLTAGAWSLIGHAGLSQGQANQNQFSTEAAIPGLLGGSRGEAGSMNGYLQAVTTVGFQYVSPEVVPIDTKWTPSLSTPPSSTQNTIEVGATKYVSDTVQDGVVAVQALVLDPGDLHQIDGGTYRLMTSNGSTDSGGIYFLDQLLNKYVNDHSVGASDVIVLQDFGSQGCSCWPSGDDVDWLQDQIPNNNESSFWSGQNFPNSRAQLLRSWNASNVHGFGSVAGNLGKLVGGAFHDVVANYRRPYYDPNAGRVLPRTTGGLTAIANTNLYQQSDAFGQGQTNRLLAASNKPLLGDGRITGVLRRNEQGQWRMGASALGAGIPGATGSSDTDSFDTAALSQLVYAPPTPWPCSAQAPSPCTGNPDQLTTALTFLSQHAAENQNVTNVREYYASDTIDWGTYSFRIQPSQLTCPSQASFSQADCTKLQNLLIGEFNDLGAAKTGFNAWNDLVSKNSQNAQFNIQTAAGNVTAAVRQAKKDLLTQNATLNATSTLSSVLYLVSSIADVALVTEEAPELEFAPGSIAGVADLLDLGNEVFPFFNPPEPQNTVPDDTGAIRDTTQNLGNDLQLRFSAIEGTLKHFLDLIRTDPVKLHQAAVNFGDKWSLDTKNERRIDLGVATGIAASMYKALMPIAFTQWIVGPARTNINPGGPADLPNRGYNCDNLDGDGNIDGFDNPLVNEPSSMSAMNSIGWNGSPGPQTNYTLRFLKFKDDPLVLQGPQHNAENGNTFVEHRGKAPAASLTDPLFQPQSDLDNPDYPTELGIDKTDFFGQPSWQIRKLQCGSVQR